MFVLERCIGGDCHTRAGNSMRRGDRPSGVLINDGDNSFIIRVTNWPGDVDAVKRANVRLGAGGYRYAAANLAACGNSTGRIFVTREVERCSKCFLLGDQFLTRTLRSRHSEIYFV